MDCEAKTSIGQIIFDTLYDEVIIDSEKWAIDRSDAIMERFQKHCNLDKNYKVIIPWITTHTAFTAPGDYIFFSRKLFQECATEEMAALIIAHEISHHMLGHLAKFPTYFEESTKTDIHFLMAALYRVVESRIHGPEQECDADRHAIDMCIAAGI